MGEVSAPETAASSKRSGRVSGVIGQPMTPSTLVLFVHRYASFSQKMHAGHRSANGLVLASLMALVGESAGAPFQSIIAALRDPSADGATDGVVPIASARLAGAQSEVLVRAHHLCLDQPKVIQAVREVLIAHITPRAGLRPTQPMTPGLRLRCPLN